MDQLASVIAGIDITGDHLIPLVAITGSALVAVVWAIMWAIVSTAQSKEAERTRREIAAYVSEGSITPEEGERLIRTAPGKRSCGA